MSRPDVSITVVIADDEPLGRELVRHMLNAHGDFRILAECGDGETAVGAIKRHDPQLVFLDVRMPGLDGLGVLQQIGATGGPLFVFITAHDGYAIRAFEADALDYLLKPFDQERFDQTITRVRAELAQRVEAKWGQTLRRLLTEGELSRPERVTSGATARVWPERIVVRESGRITFVAMEEILWLEASGNYVALHTASGKTHLVHETMTALEAKLDPARFLRIHRSTIVQLNRIKELQPHFNGEFVVVLKDNSRLKLSRGYLDPARKALGLE